jgi:hypothetical protein
MPAATTLPLRQQIFDLCRAGESPSHVARLLALPERTVRRLAARWLAAPPASLAPLPARGGRPLAAHPPPLLRCCLDLRRDNPGWGAGRIRLEMLAMHKCARVPPRAPCSAGSKAPA